MTTKHRRYRNIILAVVAYVAICIAIVACSSGCADYSVEQAKADRAVLVEGIATIDAEIAKLPPGDKVRVQYEAQRLKLSKALGAADAVVSGVGTGDFSGLASLGQYGGLAALVMTLLWKVKQSADRHNALKAVVASVDVAFPNKTEQQKEVLATVQGAEVSATVNKIKSAS